jgi:signal transduction histidine kinase
MYDFCLQTKLHAKKNFVRYVSHEIRTPLNTVFLGLQLLADHLEQLSVSTKSTIAVTGMELCDDIKGSCFIAIEILNDLLLYDKIEDGSIIVDLRPLPLSPLIESVISMFQVQVSTFC